MNADDVNKILRTENPAYDKDADWKTMRNVPYDGFEIFHDCYEEKKNFEYRGHKFVSKDIGVGLDGDHSHCCYVFEVDGELFMAVGYADSWVDDNSLGDFNIVKCRPADRVIQIYEEVRE